MLKHINNKTLICLALLCWAVSARPVQAELNKMTVYKTPSCQCCSKWVDHLTENELASDVIELQDLSPIKSQYQIAGRYRSCHTGVVVIEEQSYVFEGHVPADYVKQFLASPPAGAIGLSVPGMPIGSPGMEVGERRDYYQVLQLNEDGSSEVYAHVNQPEAN